MKSNFSSNTVRTLLFLCAALPITNANSQTSLNAFYPAPDAVIPVGGSPVLAARKYLAAGVPPASAALQTGPVAAFTDLRGARLNYLYLYHESPGAGQCATIDLPGNLWSGLVAPRPTEWVERIVCGDSGVPPPTGRRWKFTDAFEFKSLVRRRAWDGGEFEASPMVQTRNGERWLTTYWAYRIGLAETQFDWDTVRLSTLPAFAGWPRYAPRDEEVVLISLPPPIVEEEVVEYVNRNNFPAQPGGQFFYAVTQSDKELLDSLSNWARTGKAFRSGGYVSVCRLYGGTNGGPNTHFYSAEASECEALMRTPQLVYEGQTFRVNLPLPAKNAAQQVPGATRDCPVASKPLYRVYNNASNSSGAFVSNHRYLTERADVLAVVAQGWIDEGHVMCVPQ